MNCVSLNLIKSKWSFVYVDSAFAVLNNEFFKNIIVRGKNISGDYSFLLWGAAGGLTGHSQVGVGLNFSRLVSGKALKHPRVVGQEAVDLQAAAHQHPVPGRLHRVDGQSILVPHDVRLRHSCTQRAQEQSWSSSFRVCTLHWSFINTPEYFERDYLE